MTTLNIEQVSEKDLLAEINQKLTTLMTLVKDDDIGIMKRLGELEKSVGEIQKYIANQKTIIGVLGFIGGSVAVGLKYLITYLLK